MFELMVFFRGSGWRRRFSEQDGLEIWSGLERIAEIPGALLLQLVSHYLIGADLVGQVRQIRKPLARILEPAFPRNGNTSIAPHASRNGSGGPGASLRRLLGANGRRLRGLAGGPLNPR